MHNPLSQSFVKNIEKKKLSKSRKKLNFCNIFVTDRIFIRGIQKRRARCRIIIILPRIFPPVYLSSTPKFSKFTFIFLCQLADTDISEIFEKFPKGTINIERG